MPRYVLSTKRDSILIAVGVCVTANTSISSRLPRLRKGCGPSGFRRAHDHIRFVAVAFGEHFMDTLGRSTLGVRSSSLHQQEVAPLRRATW